MKCLLDTNIFVEAFKGQEEAQNLIELLIDNTDKFEIYIPFNVVEEITFLLIKKTSKTDYWSLKKNKTLVKENFVKIKPYLEFILNLCEILYPNEKVLFKAFDYIERYGLLPNDAFVLAFCKVFEMEILISFDSDFYEVAKKEGIRLVSSVEDFRKWLKR